MRPSQGGLGFDRLVGEAQRRTGLSDFGPDTWQEGLGVLVKALDEEAALTTAGEVTLAERIVEQLVQRLKFEHSWNEHPEIADEHILSPVVGVGLGRTGSNALGFVMAQDPARRVLRAFEAMEPSPPENLAQVGTDADPRIAKAQAEHETRQRDFPETMDKVPVNEDGRGPTECVFLLAFDFRSQLFEAWGRIPSYSTWLFACDMTPAYDIHRRILQMLQWQCGPKKWFIRSPPHMHGIFELGRVYPDARFVQTHRNVDAMIPSEAALFSAFLTPMTADPDEPYLGRHLAEVRVECLRRLMAFRDDGREDRFFDIGFYDMQADAMGQIRKLYTWLGDDLSDVAAQRMGKWWQENSAERQGAREYDPARYGVEPEDLRQRFAFYHDRYPDLVWPRTRT
ncbi:MAG: sulfotransferase [Actinomycetota bacterium]|nr:sulfotransferase [Actinomycetota bacterium]